MLEHRHEGEDHDDEVGEVGQNGGEEGIGEDGEQQVGEDGDKVVEVVEGQLPEHGEDGEDDIIGGGVGDGEDDIIGGGVGDGEDDIIGGGVDGGGVDGGVGDVQDEFDVSSWVGSDEDASVNEDDLEDVILEGDEEPEQEESEGSLFGETDEITAQL
ncbi:uncharacterized protein HKW66_Vig0228160 [Vigna angularis]|uniref:Uncharacterized protein n=1 Tax=Phaseolus angularis TaxID=3914 RepID=A0A8T0KAE3_PHAAN|nr:uncharacterized protein HKW66_Vig0228160 [Vigna angularis]